jgi:hypothetical protein
MQKHGQEFFSSATLAITTGVTGANRMPIPLLEMTWSAGKMSLHFGGVRIGNAKSTACHPVESCFLLLYGRKCFFPLFQLTLHGQAHYCPQCPPAPGQEPRWTWPPPGPLPIAPGTPSRRGSSQSTAPRRCAPAQWTGGLPRRRATTVPVVNDVTKPQKPPYPTPHRPTDMQRPPLPRTSWMAGPREMTIVLSWAPRWMATIRSRLAVRNGYASSRPTATTATANSAAGFIWRIGGTIGGGGTGPPTKGQGKVGGLVAFGNDEVCRGWNKGTGIGTTKQCFNYFWGRALF